MSSAIKEINPITGKAIYKRSVIGNTETYEEGIALLVEYNKSAEEKLNDIKETITFADIFDKASKEWFVSLSESAKKGYLGAYNKLSCLYSIKIKDIKTELLQETINPYLSCNGLKNRIKIVFNKVFDYALRYDFISKDYSKFINLGKSVCSAKREIYTQEEIEKLWDIYNSNSNITDALINTVKTVLIMIYTGMRIGEVHALKKENIFIDKDYCIGGIKTSAGKNRIIPLCKKIKPIIESFVSDTDNRKATLLNTNLNISSFNSYIRRNLLYLGINHKSHDCRHTFASLMRKADIQIDITQTIMGHKTNTLLLDCYTHYEPNTLIEAVNRI